jgi:hypothetical protein
MTNERSFFGTALGRGRDVLRRVADRLLPRQEAEGNAHHDEETMELTAGSEQRAATRWERLIADLATGVWRLKKRFVEPGTDRPREELRRSYRDVEALWDALAQAGVQVIDPTGKPYDPAESLTVLAFQPTPGLLAEKVLETVRPTVYMRSHWVQMAEVIVGTPAC